MPPLVPLERAGSPEHLIACGRLAGVGARYPDSMFAIVEVLTSIFAAVSSWVQPRWLRIAISSSANMLRVVFTAPAGHFTPPHVLAGDPHAGRRALKPAAASSKAPVT